MQGHVGLSEAVGQHDEIAQVPREPVEPPGEHVGHVTIVDHAQHLLEAGPLEVLARESGVGDDGHLTEVVQPAISAIVAIGTEDWHTEGQW